MSAVRTIAAVLLAGGTFVASGSAGAYTDGWNDWPEWTPMYWMDEFLDRIDRYNDIQEVRYAPLLSPRNRYNTAGIPVANYYARPAAFSPHPWNASLAQQSVKPASIVRVSSWSPMDSWTGSRGNNASSWNPMSSWTNGSNGGGMNSWNPMNSWGGGNSWGPMNSWNPTQAWNPTNAWNPMSSWTGGNSWGPMNSWNPTQAWNPTNAWNPMNSWTGGNSWGPMNSMNPAQAWNPTNAWNPMNSWSGGNSSGPMSAWGTPNTWGPMTSWWGGNSSPNSWNPWGWNSRRPAYGRNGYRGYQWPTQWAGGWNPNQFWNWRNPRGSVAGWNPQGWWGGYSRYPYQYANRGYAYPGNAYRWGRPNYYSRWSPQGSMWNRGWNAYPPRRMYSWGTGYRQPVNNYRAGRQTYPPRSARPPVESRWAWNNRATRGGGSEFRDPYPSRAGTGKRQYGAASSKPAQPVPEESTDMPEYRPDVPWNPKASGGASANLGNGFSSAEQAKYYTKPASIVTYRSLTGGDQKSTQKKPVQAENRFAFNP